MAQPLSCDLPLSPELRNIFEDAERNAVEHGVAMGSVHLMIALCVQSNEASSFLEQQRARLPHLLSLADPARPESDRVVRALRERMVRIARSSGAVQVGPLHLLAAVLREVTSGAYRLLESSGVHLGGIRTAALSRATGASLRRRPTPPPAPDAAPEAVGLVEPTTPRQQIGFHPGLGVSLRSTPLETPAVTRKPRRRRRRAGLEEHSSPVHPALHDSWLRTTPSEGLPALRREDAIAKPATPELITDDPLECDPGKGRGHEFVRERAKTKTLKDRFAERKREAMNRRHYLATRGATPPPPPQHPPGVTPPKAAVVGAEALPPLLRKTRVRDPEPVVEPVKTEEEEERDRQRAFEDAKTTTQNLAARLFKRKAPVEVAEPVVTPSTEEILAAAPAAEEPATSGHVTLRPDPSLAARYRLDPEDYPLLSKYGRNLTEEAALARIDRVIGRDQETDALIDVLGKRRGNNPLLVGDPGVGKTAIVEGLAHRFCDLARRGSRLGERVVIELEIGRLLSGTHLRGSFSERLIGLKDEVRHADGHVIVFLDEIHSWINAGAGGDGGSDAAGELKTALARGQFPCIGATTNDEFREFIEGDPAFERRFQIVEVEEPDMETATKIAHGVREHYEHHHGITYADAAIDSAVRLSHRYIHERRLPDKAISVLDLAGSRAARTGRLHVGRADVARVVAEVAGLPAERLTRADRARFLEIERHLERSVIGHTHVIRAVSEVLRRNYAGFRSSRPIGSLLFLGPTGVGKTELVKALADFLFHDRDAIVRLDMSEFMEAHSVSRFIGAPPGYVGYEQGGQLTEAVRRRPYQIILLDEIEKAHPDVLNLLLQLLDEGRLTDGRGRTVDFSNTVVIMTSNLGAQAFEDDSTEESRVRIGFGGGAVSARTTGHHQRLTQGVKQLAQGHFPPELWNRIDERLVFMPLLREEIAQIAGLQLKDSARRLEEESGIALTFDRVIIEHLIDNGGYDRRFGARPMRQTIQRLVEGDLARLILSGQVKRGDTVNVSLEQGQLEFELLS